MVEKPNPGRKNPQKCRYIGVEEEPGMRDQPGKHQYFAMSDTVLDAEYVPRQGYSAAMLRAP